MALTLAQLKAKARHAIAGIPSAAIDETETVNEAGRYLYQCHDWNFRQRPPVEVSFVDGQSYVDLPAECGEITAIALNGLTKDIQWTTPQTLAEMRDIGLTPAGFVYWATITKPVDDDVKARLELYPTPGTGTLSIWYLADWMDLSQDTDIAAVRPFVEALLVQYCRAFLAGYEEHDTATLGQRLAEIEASPLFKNAKRRDAMEQPDYGPIRNGAAEVASAVRLDIFDGVTSYETLS